MCGITGGFAFKPEGMQFLNKIDAANSCLRHRGPDGGGIFHSRNVALGHRRLSIIDTSAIANQPLYSRDGRYSIVFNGEIFNYKALKELYLGKHQFVTTSDTEVLLELFIRKGTDAFRELRGFFAAAIYDKQEEELYIFRDRFGKKPLHFFQNEEVFLFASELKSLLAFGIPKELNWQVLPFYFQLNYLPQPLSFLKNVQKLKPGHFLKISKNGATQHCYFRLSLRKEDYNMLSYEMAKEKLVELLGEATRLRLVADVPLGAFLSGGVDSSVIVALASRYKQHLNTFSIGYKDNPFFDETYYANLVARKFGTEHHVFSLGNEDFLEHIDSILESIDEPFADSSLIPTYILSRETRKHVTVALSGDGGDEVFAGYNKYKAERYVMQSSVKNWLVKGLQPLWAVLPKSRNNSFGNVIRQLHRFSEGVRLTPGERYWQWASLLPREASLEMFASTGVHNQVRGKHLSEIFPLEISGRDLNEVLLADMNLVLAGDMLVKVDMMSMANSLEVRSPFLDQEVVAFAFGLPMHYKIDARMTKRVVQDSFRNILPPELYNRPKKGFDIPLLHWFRKELNGKITNGLLADSFIREQGIFDEQSIQNFKRRLFSSDPGDSHETIWALLVFQHWWKRYMA